MQSVLQGVSTLFLQTAWRAWYRAGSPAPQAVPPSFTKGGTATSVWCTGSAQGPSDVGHCMLPLGAAVIVAADVGKVLSSPRATYKFTRSL